MLPVDNLIVTMLFIVDFIKYKSDVILQNSCDCFDINLIIMIFG